MASNALGRAAEGAPNNQATRTGAGAAANQDNAKNNAGTQRDGTPTNLGVKPTNPGTKFFKPGNSGPVSGMERAAAKAFKR